MLLSLKNKKIKYSIVIFLCTILVGTIFFVFNDKETLDDSNVVQEPLVSQVTADLEMKITLISHYIVGEDLIENKVEYVKSLSELKNLYSEWQVVEDKNNQVIFERYVEDLSPECKEGTYFSLNPDGYLTLFRGDPINKSVEDKIIETFFRIDVIKLEGSLPIEPIQELYDGIPIKDRADFNSVLSTFSEFSIE